MLINNDFLDMASDLLVAVLTANQMLGLKTFVN